MKLRGRLIKKPTVGYRSPFRIGDVELRGHEELLEEFVGRDVTVEGTWEEIPGGKAEPGSEAERRFVGGIIPHVAVCSGGGGPGGGLTYSVTSAG